MARGQTEGAFFKRWQELSSLSDGQEMGGAGRSPGHCSLEARSQGRQGLREVGVLAFPLHVGSGHLSFWT